MGISPFQRVRTMCSSAASLLSWRGWRWRSSFCCPTSVRALKASTPVLASSTGIILSTASPWSGDALCRGYGKSSSASRGRLRISVPVRLRSSTKCRWRPIILCAPFPRELESMKDPEEILAAEQPADQGWRRYKIYRQLLFGPVIYARTQLIPTSLSPQPPQPHRRRDAEDNFEFQFELYKNAALLTTPERRAKLTYFPDNRTISDIAIQFAGLARDIKEQEDIPIQYDGSISCPGASAGSDSSGKSSATVGPALRELDARVARELLATSRIGSWPKRTRRPGSSPFCRSWPDSADTIPKISARKGEDTDDR